jgi:hypothetical protein
MSGAWGMFSITLSRHKFNAFFEMIVSAASIGEMSLNNKHYQ